MTLEKPLDKNEDGVYPAYAWPGGYPIYYLSRDGMVCCPECANRDIDDGQAIVSSDINWEDDQLICDDCGKRIESAYGTE